MQADFLDAHERHWHDAEHLLQAKRWANADHLYGIAAECGLKGLMLAFGMPYDRAKDRPDSFDDRVHAKGIWTRFEIYRSGKISGTDYILSAQNPFQNWDVSDRYANQSNFDEVLTQTHQQGAQAVCDLISKAKREGWL